MYLAHRQSHPKYNIATLTYAADLQLLAIERLREAECLLASGHFHGAHHLGGYAIELALKAIACRKLNVEIFDKTVVPGHIARAFMIHDLSDLIFLAGLSQDLKILSSSEGEFANNWSLVSDWSEQRRYDLRCDPQTAKNFLESVKIVLSWLQKIW